MVRFFKIGCLTAVRLDEKEKELESILRSLDRVLVAFSGGVDSSYLAYKAHSVLGSGALAVTSQSPSVPLSQIELAIRIARQFGFAHEIIHTGETELSEYQANTPARCYLCKNVLFDRLAAIARERGFKTVLDGLNADDLGDYRPGRQAAEEHQVLSPLLQVHLNKEEIRQLSRRAGLPTADLPASACLASRFPYGVRITDEKLKIVDRGEEALLEMGFRVFRVRHHDALVRLEFGREELGRALNLEMGERLTALFKDLGYKYVTIDLQGYRTGSLNEVLPAAKK
jgi:pyridinium-3,5-biscarboxylic acid mononucleotide sulfurtransferase